jgi:hypothetical protein
MRKQTRMPSPEASSVKLARSSLIACQNQHRFLGIPSLVHGYGQSVYVGTGYPKTPDRDSLDTYLTTFQIPKIIVDSTVAISARSIA